MTDTDFDRKNYSLLYRDWEAYPPRNLVEKSVIWAIKIFVNPMIYLKKNIIEPNQKTYYWYHRKYPRVPTIDQCYDYDVLCQWEADRQLELDKRVESQIIALLMERFDDCMAYEQQEGRDKCTPLYHTWKDSETNYFIKYGDIGGGPNYARKVFMKQKHRLLWERRHGPVGTGKKTKYYHPDGTAYYK